jgi:hypothetical protein
VVISAKSCGCDDRRERGLKAAKTVEKKIDAVGLCEVCIQKFIIKSSQQLYCSDRCSVVARSWRYGGKRTGAGRKSIHGERKEVASVRMTPTLREFLDDQGESMSELIEDAIRKTKKFREWLKARG